MLDEMEFRFQSFKELIAQGRDEQGRVELSRLERAFCDAADFDTERVMEGFLHPFIYRAERIPDVVWFFQVIGAAEIVTAIKSAFDALALELGLPDSDGFGDRVFTVLEASPVLNQHFDEWDAAYDRASGWAALLEEFLRSRNINPTQFWHS